MTRYFFATAADLVSVFARVQAKYSLIYTPCGLWQSSRVEPVDRGENLPTLIQPAPGRSSNHCVAYLVTPAGLPVEVRAVPQNTGGTLYAVDQLVNPDSVVLNHGGSPADGILLAGHVGTCSDTPQSAKLFRTFANAMSKEFARIQAYWVGPEARAWLAAGWRLTRSADSPAEFDLAE